MLRDEIEQFAKEIYSNVIENRRYLHAHPELSFCEYETSACVKARLDGMGIPWKVMANTGVVAIVQGEKSSDQVVALRAALQQIVSRMADPQIPTVLSFGKLIANGAVNIIPDEVYIEGTFRTLDESWRIEAHERMKKMAEAIAESMCGNCDFNIVRGYPFLINNEKLTEQVGVFAEAYIGKENVLDLDIWMAAEDFAYYSQVTDSCLYLLGTGNREKGIVSSLHTPTFNIDETALALSTGLMAYIAVKQLGN